MGTNLVTKIFSVCNQHRKGATDTNGYKTDSVCNRKKKKFVTNQLSNIQTPKQDKIHGYKNTNFSCKKHWRGRTRERAQNCKFAYIYNLCDKNKVLLLNFSASPT